MDDNLRAQIKNNLMLKETEELLEIWQTRDTDEWEDVVFDITKEILIQRLGYIPELSLDAKLSQVLRNVNRYYQSGQLNQALSECDLAIQIVPKSAIAYNHRGLIYDELEQKEKAFLDFKTALQLDPEMDDARDNLRNIEKEFQGSESKLDLDLALDHVDNDEPKKTKEESDQAIQMAHESAIAYNSRGLVYDDLGQPENALSDFQTAVQLDPDYRDSLNNLISLEKEIQEKFELSNSKYHLDLALDYVYNDEPEKALEECEIAKSTMPNIAAAHNYLGIILEEMGLVEPAIESYLKAVQCNPRFYAARENLGNARYRLEESQTDKIFRKIRKL